MALDENGFVSRFFRLLFVTHGIQFDEFRQIRATT
jgi:hypothetical protein